MPGDLHTHTTYSDGSTPVAKLPFLARCAGMTHLAISDHDSIQSVRYAYAHPVQDGVRLIPAAELTGYDYERQHRVHLLAFWPDPESPALRRHCDLMRQRRNECCLQSAREIEAIYPQFRTEQALEYTKDSGVLYKSGIMQALQQLGLCDGIYTGLYHELFGWEPRGKCLHSPTYPPVREVLATAKAAGAVVVFAHPTVYKSMPLLRELVAEGAIDGIEVHHPRNSPEDMAECAELCKKHDLIVTGGSDFHGANHGKPHPVGACVTEDDQIVCDCLLAPRCAHRAVVALSLEVAGDGDGPTPGEAPAGARAPRSGTGSPAAPGGSGGGTGADGFALPRAGAAGPCRLSGHRHAGRGVAGAGLAGCRFIGAGQAVL